MSNIATELEFLKFFFVRVRPCLGPADGDIVESIQKEFVEKTGKELPPEYAIEEEDPGWIDYTLEEFENSCNLGVLTDDDGSGIYMNRGNEGTSVSCSGFSAEALKKNHKFATGIRWFPK